MIRFKKIQKLKNLLNGLAIKLDYLPPIINNILNLLIQTRVKLKILIKKILMSLELVVLVQFNL